MRTIRWSSFLILPVAIALLATVNPAAAAVFGFKGGLSVATLRGNMADNFPGPVGYLPADHSSKLGFAVGGWIAIPLGSSLSLQPELNYVQKGASLGTVEVSDGGGSIEILEALDYVELPVLLRVSLPGGGMLSPYLVGGPVVGLQLSQQIRTTGTYGGVSTSIDPLFRSTDLGAAMGAGFELGRGPFRGTFETRYTLGLTTASEDIYSSEAKNRAFLVTMGLAIHR